MSCEARSTIFDLGAGSDTILISLPASEKAAALITEVPTSKPI
jgi:hypothetical protein